MRLLHLTLPAFCLAALASTGSLAQSAAQTSVVQAENVRLDYAHVLNVEPVYQTLRATRTEMQCEEPPAPVPVKPTEEQEGRWARIVNSVKGVFSETPEPPPAPEPAPEPECRLVPVKREFRRPIAYDVDYVYKGIQYRSRLAEDPGNRLRIRISVMPYVPN